MSHDIENAKLNLDESMRISRTFISELLSEDSPPDEHRKAVVSTVAQVEAMLAVARSIEYLAETLRDLSGVQKRQ